MMTEDHELIGWEVEGVTIASEQALPIGKGGAESSTTVGGSGGPPRRRSLRDVKPLACGPLLRPFDRAEIADEMYDR